MSKSIHIPNLPSGISEEDLRATFESFGPVVNVRIRTRKITNGRRRNQSPYFAFVNFEDMKAAQDALDAPVRSFMVRNHLIDYTYHKSNDNYNYDRKYKCTNNDNYCNRDRNLHFNSYSSHYNYDRDGKWFTNRNNNDINKRVQRNDRSHSHSFEKNQHCDRQSVKSYDYLNFCFIF